MWPYLSTSDVTQLRMLYILLEYISSLLAKAFTWHGLLISLCIIFLSWLFFKLFAVPYYSPLRKIPGRTTGNIILGNFLEIVGKHGLDTYVDWVQEMNLGILRFHHLLRKPEVLIADAEALKHLLITRADKYSHLNCRLGIAHNLEKIFSSETSLGLWVLEGPEHGVQRRLCESAFKLSFLHGLLPVFQRHIECMCNVWTKEVRNEKEGPAVLNVHESIIKMTFHAAVEATMGDESHLIHTPKKMSLVSSHMTSKGLLCILRDLLNFLPAKDSKDANGNLNMLCFLFQRSFDKRRKYLDKETDSDIPETKCLLESLLSAVDEETGAMLSRKHAQDHILSFILAGHEPTAATLCWALLCLAQHPDIQHKARQEVVKIIPSFGQPVTVWHLEALTYLNCVIKETLRLYPPMPLLLRRSLEEDVICGYLIPKDTTITVSINALHRNPVYWKNPDQFIPERFQDESAIIPYSYQPFLSGPHACIGSEFAVLDLKMTLAMLLRKFEFSPIPDVIYSKKIQLMAMHPDPPLTLHVRCLE